MANEKMHILVCGGTGCISAESELIIDNLNKYLKEENMDATVKVLKTGCFGFCEKGPIVKILPDNTFYVQVTPADAEEIVKEHIVKGRKVERLLFVDPDKKEIVEDSKNMDFYKKQMRIALRNCGFIDPASIDDYIARDGYLALGKALHEMTPESVIQEMKDSGLRGRGGGGFPTGLKWSFARSYEADQKYVICNADEGDPGAFMDRSILEGDPHSIIEAMAICGYAIGATKGQVYIRAEYPLAIKRLEAAIEVAREYGLLGTDILGSGFDFDIQLSFGAGAFVVVKKLP
jgi:(2Fe-2S) ferredoxin